MQWVTITHANRFKARRPGPRLVLVDHGKGEAVQGLVAPRRREQLRGAHKLGEAQRAVAVGVEGGKDARQQGVAGCARARVQVGGVSTRAT